MTRRRIGNAPCSWGVLEFDETTEPLGYSRVLDEMTTAGYVGTELGDWGFLPTEPGRIRDELARRKLELIGGFVPVALRLTEALAAGQQAALRTAQLLHDAGGEDCLLILSDENAADPQRRRVAGRVGKAHQLSATDWDLFARGATTIATAVLEQTGLRTVFHHHAAGYVETPDEVAELMKRTEPHLLGLCLDTGHWAFGGGDPVRAIKQYGPRIRHVHLKDWDRRIVEYDDYFDAVRQGVFCELGDGSVDFGAVQAELDRVGYDGWIVVEQDVLPHLGSPLESARRNRSFLASLGL